MVAVRLAASVRHTQVVLAAALSCLARHLSVQVTVP